MIRIRFKVPDFVTMADNDTYSLLTGLIFVFNLILGTGVLTMPSIFAQAGYLFGILVICFLCFISYVQVTFLIEAMANANFHEKIRDLLSSGKSFPLRFALTTCPIAPVTNH